MKSAKVYTYIFLPLLFSVFLLLNIDTSIAIDLDSTNYKIVGASATSGGGLGDSTNYSLIATVGEISADPRNYSSSYILQQDPSVTFIAAVPLIQCLEATTDGTSACTTGPSLLSTGGMTALCGPFGCYDRGRFEIDTQGNPTDTVYGVEISTDNFVNDKKCIDGSTFIPKTFGNCNINDFRNKNDWESSTFNIQNLKPNTTYYVRITAMHGDFTQSDYSPIKSFTTGIAAIYFDIDIAPTTGTTNESDSPYNVALQLIAGGAATTSDDLIWLDASSSSQRGISILQYGKNGGLFSPTTTETILSQNINLDNTLANGFGLQNYYTSSNTTSPYYGTISTISNYAGIGNTVGAVQQTANKIYQSDKLLVEGRMGMYVKARAKSGQIPATDYTETIYFTLVPIY